MACTSGLFVELANKMNKGRGIFFHENMVSYLLPLHASACHQCTQTLCLGGGVFLMWENEVLKRTNHVKCV